MIHKFDPIFINKPWGGDKIINKPGIGEAFLISDLKDQKTLSNNKTLQSIIKKSHKKYFGEEIVAKYGINLPIYVKEIDANDDLSIQVHPNNELAKQLENETFGKSEAWYILDANEGSGLYLGLKEDVTKATFEQAVANNEQINKLLNFIPVKKNEIYYIPAGLIHAIGKGIHILEVQQNSNTTYRVYDYGRKDKLGNQRELHIEKALQSINFEKEFNKEYSLKQNENCIDTPYFKIRKITLKSNIQNEVISKFNIVLAMNNTIEINSENVSIVLSEKRCAFIPAFLEKYNIKSQNSIVLIIEPK